MIIVSVSELVGENGLNLLGLGRLNKGIENNDVLALFFDVSKGRADEKKKDAYPWQAEEVGIAVRTAFRTINLVRVLERELELARQNFNPITQVTLWKS